MSTTFDRVQTDFYLSVTETTSRVLSSGSASERDTLFRAGLAGNSALQIYSESTPSHLYSCNEALDIYRKAFCSVMWGSVCV